MSDGGSDSPGWSARLTAQTTKCYVSELDMISQLEKMGGAVQDVLTQNLGPLSIPTFQFTMAF